MYNEQKFFLAGFMIGVLVALFMASILSISDSSVTKGKQFILGHATYKCIKTNELKSK